MVMNGTLRQSSRPFADGGCAASASLRTAGGNTCGMPCALIAIRLTAFSLLTEPSRSTTRAVARPNPRRGGADFDRAEVAVLGVAGRACRDHEFAAELLLVDRREPAAATRQRAEDAERPLFGAVQDLDDAAGVGGVLAIGVGFFDPQQRAVADAGDFAGTGLAHGADVDFRGAAVRFLVPFGRDGDQLAVAVAGGDVGHHDVGEGAGTVQLLVAALDNAGVGELAQHALEGGAVGVLEPEGARDLAGADFAGLLADEGNDVVFGREVRFGGGACHV